MRMYILIFSERRAHIDPLDMGPFLSDAREYTMSFGLPRIELGTVQCECTGIPLTYEPVITDNTGESLTCESGDDSEQDVGYKKKRRPADECIASRVRCSVDTKKIPNVGPENNERKNPPLPRYRDLAPS